MATEREDGKTRHDKERHVENVAEKLRLAAKVPDAMEDMSAHGDVRYDWKRLAKWLLDSGALEMPRACDVDEHGMVLVDEYDYDRQAAAIRRIKGGGDD